MQFFSTTWITSFGTAKKWIEYVDHKLVQHRSNFRTPKSHYVYKINFDCLFGYPLPLPGDSPIGPLWSHREFTFMFPHYKIKIHYLHLLPSKSFDDYYNDVCWFSFFSRLSHIHSSSCQKIETSRERVVVYAKMSH